ncbi:hypothetical protein F4804DRAFT_343906 [Jackrogersella minutella]|nr:hypothetical protein F4804DRAFT_343906 [Jackrogersella minutella]
MSRHTACKICRDRKVRCDGNQPTCDRCTRSGDECVYAPPALPSRGELAQTIETLQERLGEYAVFQYAVKAEARILEQHDAIDSRNQCTGLPNPYCTSMLHQSSTLDLQMPFTAPTHRTTSIFIPNGDFGSPGQAYIDSDDMNDFFGSLQNSRASSRPPTGIQEEIPQISLFGDTLPSLNELRAMNGHRGSTDLSSGCDTPPGSDNGNAALMNASLLDLMSCLFSIQADIAGLSSAVAEYLAWMRTSPTKANNATVLEILEARVRELNQIASTRHWSAFKNMYLSIEKADPSHILLRRLESDLMDSSVKTLRFFHDRYEITTTLLEQRHG